MPPRLLALAALALALTATPAASQTVTATPPTGPVVGTVGSVMHGFRGIPYGEAPVGALRWAPPVARAPWTTPLDAATFGNRCPQNDTPFGDPSTNEDCLVLNVYVPHRKAVPERDLRRKRPVMVWIHGGAFIAGSAESYDPTKLVTEGDVVVVTINYRLGTLGFLAHPALSAESSDGVSGNYGILDQQLALRWVHDNIAAFGGNPKRVTIFGESAGGVSVHTQLASPLAAGLFHRAIAQSGAIYVQPTLAEAETSGTGQANDLGCGDQTAACLRGLSVADVLAAQPTGLRSSTPVVDGVVLPLPILDAFESGAFNRVPTIEGSNHDEMRLFVALLFDLQGGPVTEEEYPAAVAALLGVPEAVAPVLIAHYPASNYASPGLALSALATDAAFACNARTSSLALSPYVPTYAYEFADENAPQLFLPPASFPYGAAHAFELQYLFDLAGPVPPEPLDPGQQQLSETMIRYWTRFARTGKPTAPRSPRWPRFDSNSSGGAQMLSLVPPQPVTMTESVFSFDHQCGFWGPLLN
jgi:para-nitrobenzyl esterase